MFWDLIWRKILSKFAVPTWMLEAMPDRADEFTQLAFQAELKAVQPQLDAIKSMVLTEQTDHEYLESTLKSIIQTAVSAYNLIASTQVQAQAPTQTPKSDSTLTPDQKYAKARNGSVWHYINAQVAGKYVDPGDMKSKNPESYRQLRAEAVRLYDEGKLTPSGKLK